MNNDNNNELIWGEIKVQDLLKKLYKGKSLEQMSEKEVDRMLEDLIWKISLLLKRQHNIPEMPFSQNKAQRLSGNAFLEQEYTFLIIAYRIHVLFLEYPATLTT